MALPRWVEDQGGEWVARNAAVKNLGYLQELHGEFPEADHLRCVLEKAQTMVNSTLAPRPDRNDKS